MARGRPPPEPPGLGRAKDEPSGGPWSCPRASSGPRGPIVAGEGCPGCGTAAAAAPPSPASTRLRLCLRRASERAPGRAGQGRAGPGGRGWPRGARSPSSPKAQQGRAERDSPLQALPERPEPELGRRLPRAGASGGAFRFPFRTAARMARQAPYCRPPIPFTGPICGGLCEGLIVTVTGSVLHLCTRFQINFQCGSAKVPQPDIAFHFNPRFDEGGCIVWNSFERGSWQHEERQSSMPFHKGHPFEIRFLVKSSSYMVAVNGKHYLEFKHRIPISRVDTISVSGDLEVASITFQGPAAPALWTAQSAAMTNAAFPLGMPYNQGAAFPPGPYFQPQIYSLPYQASLFGGLFPSKSVIVSGTVLARASRFHINLKMGQDTAFHLNPRFKEKVIVRNSQFSGRWGPEERHLQGSMPLHPEQAFTIWIQCEQQCFRVAVNGQHQFDYYHRAANLQQIDRLEIEGDVLLSEVRA